VQRLWLLLVEMLADTRAELRNAVHHEGQHRAPRACLLLRDEV
jgi:hypothetical protein